MDDLLCHKFISPVIVYCRFTEQNKLTVYAYSEFYRHYFLNLFTLKFNFSERIDCHHSQRLSFGSLSNTFAIGDITICKQSSRFKMA